MLKRILKSIHYLRVYIFAFILIAFFYFIGLEPVNVSKFIGAKISQAVGMSVSIPENPFNHLALQLQDKENRLNQKESELNQRENNINNGLLSQSKLMLVMGAGIILLFCLILINFFLDYRRRRLDKLTFLKK